jgi:autotransporter-associated beta strand protein
LNTQTVRLAAGSILNVSGVTPVDPATVPTPLGAATNLNGIGTVSGPMATISGNSISPGLNASGTGGSIGTLTTGDLTLATGTTLNFVLGTPGTTNPGTGSFINVMGNLTLNNGINLQFADNANQGGQGSFGNGLYKLLAYSGTLSGFDAGTTFAGPLGHAYTFSSTAPTAGEIRVLVSTAGLSWTGRDGGNGTANSAWNTAAPNWANGATAAAYADPAIVTFQDTNTVTNTPITNGNVQVQTGGVTPTNVFFTNHSVTYTLTSSDAIGIAGSGSLVKRGTGMTILAGANTYTGSTQVRTGTLRLGHAEAVQNSTVVQDSVLQFAPGVSTFTVGGLEGTAGLALNDTANAPITLRVGNNGASTAYTGVLSGTGGLTKIGAGTLSLSGDSNFTGNLAIDGGTLVANLGKNAVNSTSGALGNANAAGRTIAVNAGGTLNLGAGDVFGTVASGPMAATLIVNQGGTVTNSNNAYNTLGAVQLNGGTIAATGGTSASYPAFQLRGNVTTAGMLTSTISATGGNSAFQLQGGTGNAITFNVGETGQDVDLLVSAPLQDGYAPGALLTKSASGLIKSGAGNMRLTAAATYTGGTIINAGTLTATQSMPGLPAAPASMQIAAGATMEFAAAADIFQGRTAYTGSGTLLKTGIGSLVFSEGLTSVSMSAGSLIDVQGGTIRAGNFNSQDNSFVGNLSSLNIAAGATFDAYATNVVFDQLTGSGTLRGGWFNGSRTITVGANNGSSTFSGAIEGNPATDAFSFAPLVKTGTGTLTLTGALNFSGSYNSNTLTVTGGTTGTPSTLNLNPTAGSLVGYIRTTSGGQGGGQVRFGPTAGDEVVVNQTAGSMFGTTLSIGEAGAAAFNVSGGTVYANAVQLGLNAGSLGTEAAALNVSGTGVVNVLANGSIVMGRNSTRPVTITQTGGTLALYSDTGVPTAPATSPVAPVTKGGTGALSFESASTAATYNLNGGLLSIPRITNTGGGNGILNLNGGKLEITSAAFTVPTGVATNVLEGGAVIDTFGLAVSFNGTLTHGGINPVDGGLTLDNVSSAGSLTLTELNTYTGPTIVDDGTLVIAGSLSGTARVDVLAGGTLAGGGSIVLAPGLAGDLNLLADGKLSPGSGVGTLSTTFAGGGELNLVPAVSQSSVGALLFELAEVAASDRVALNGGALNIGTGVLAFNDFVFSTLPGFNAGTYTLFDASTPIIGTLDPNTANLTGTVGGLMASLAMADGGNDLILTVVPEPGAIGLLLVGLLGVATRRSRKSGRG